MVPAVGDATVSSTVKKGFYRTSEGRRDEVGIVMVLLVEIIGNIYRENQNSGSRY